MATWDTDPIARAQDIPGLRPDIPFREAAARTVAVRARELFAAADGVLDTDDIEGVHDMRVASRRLRAVLEIYAPCFPPTLHRSVLKDVKRLADALGARRDPDVQLAALARFAKAAGAVQQPGLALLRGRIEAQQGEGNATLAAELRRVEDDELRRRLAELVASAGAEEEA